MNPHAEIPTPHSSRQLYLPPEGNARISVHLIPRPLYEARLGWLHIAPELVRVTPSRRNTLDQPATRRIVSISLPGFFSRKRKASTGQKLPVVVVRRAIG